jgi:predicted Zn finger-like uncharacterized protein
MEACLIARCPHCQTRYRIAPEKIGAQGARLRCKTCETVFRVRAPAEPEVATEPEDPPVALPRPVVSEVAAPPAPPEPPPPPPPLARALVAEADVEMAKQIQDFLGRWRIDAQIVHDGAEALLCLFRSVPDLAVLGGHLPGLQAPAMCEIARRSGTLAPVKLIRVAPLEEPVGAPEFEADRTLEPADLPDGLSGLLEGLGIGEAPAPAIAARDVPAPVPSPVAEDSQREVAAAERLARIIVSDIILYNEEKFVASAATGDVAQALRSELEEGRGLFEQRVPLAIRSDRDFLVEELERRASALGA